MSNQNYITDMLELKDENIIFKENFYYKEKNKNTTYKIYEGYLSYKPICCYYCGVVYDDNFEKHGFITSNIKLPNVSGYKTILRLHKQRYLCHHCKHAFTLRTPVVKPCCFISENTRNKIAVDLTKKRSEKDIALDNDVSPNTVERVMDSYYEVQKLHKNYLPEVLSFDEFKSVKTADGAMSFHMCNGITGETIDIVEDRRLDNLIKYFLYYDYKARDKVKYIIIDMYSPYISLIKKLFSNAKIVIDRFHLTQLISRSLNNTRIKIMNKDKVNYRKLKRYWRLILKDINELDDTKYHKFTCFNKLMTEYQIVEYLINTNKELKETYKIYQEILSNLKNNDFNKLELTLNNVNDDISSQMKTSVKSLLEFLPYIKNTLSTNYHNGYIEGNNNFIKVLKRIAFGFRSFRRFKARIMICKGLIKRKKESMQIA